MTEFVLLLLAGLAVNALALLAVAGGLFLIVRSHEPGAGRFGRVAAASNFFIAVALGFIGFVLIAMAFGRLGD